MPIDPLQAWQEAEHLMSAGQPERAADLYRQLIEIEGWQSPAALRLSTLAARRGAMRDTVAFAVRAAVPDEDDAALLEAVTAQLFDVGEIEAGLTSTRWPALASSADPEVLLGVGQALLAQSFPVPALSFLERAQRLRDGGAVARYLIGLAAFYAGDEGRAEQAWEAALQHDPLMPPVHRMLAKLRRQTPASNHVDRLRAAVARVPDGHPEAAWLHYALFKELDDLDDVEGAWQALDRGLRTRLRQIDYDAASDARLFDHLQRLPVRTAPTSHLAAGTPTPIFIVGMPRSGTTLLEQILGRHPQVQDAGELRDALCQLRWVCDLAGGPHLDEALCVAAEGADMALLGRRYLEKTAWRAEDRAFFTDKMPTNFLLVDYIARALPQARILHMVRDPMEVCFSNLKELFVDAYPHTYHQEEMAAHFIRYRRLMQHWHVRHPGRILDIAYEDLVRAPEPTAHRVLDFCGLAWTPEVLADAPRASAVATASAAQVREPIHTRYMGQWRRYAHHLQPLQAALADAGV
ncbi:MULTISPECIES: tetratricopeptide repeat-containing sulfotransferase family protein [unclassified Pseudoxanthomonas]|uniref:tetratricopeptide repeat-containing sulfotransferase family protein n=1 Tax=unclassified Pseudoxanthomonas TaxID=2645906 RepID=UPI0008EB4AC0|nr:MULTISPECIES: tetratricopeptide repeat-containing sulfotransferase family protein [unclassified Pseudoxanthomonas]PPJ42511.1 sulfotransferase family protein [Pseudoxanthomonas sp. KAs_5_3]SFV27052.1 Sulfotransferase family protein [Pseudoxanthomonas sp. YR558]